MWVKPLRGMVGEFGRVRRGVPVQMEAGTAKKLIDLGRAVPHDPGGKDAKGVQMKAPDPMQAARRGGRIGKAKPSQSSAGGQARKSKPST